MKVSLFDFQEDALAELRVKLKAASLLASLDNPQAISFSAPTGSGKTIVMTALFEDIFFGEPDFPAQQDAAILWISDMPELNEQTRLKIESKSDRIRVNQLVTIDANFDAERLAGGRIYFMNTQKLGSEKLLTRRGDGRQHTIWETLTNTARSTSTPFYVVIDEAHRGMRVGREVQKAQSILQKFLLGSSEDGLCRMPLVLGMSATPLRFEQLLAGTTHTVHKVYVKAQDVRESGLIKDRILIDFPENDTQAEMSLVAEAARRWNSIANRWSEYCKAQNEALVSPILVIQVEDGTDKTLTKTDLVTTLTTVESIIGRRLQDGEVAHTLNESGDLEINGHRVRRVEASRIEEDRKIGIVLFKMSLSTGWDCPRAEVMMSFRRAQDHTYIAQLLGRMVRTPLARRIESHAELNEVRLLLPHYDRTTVKSLIDDLSNVEDVPPTEVGTSRELITLKRRSGTEAIFADMDNLVTYRVDAVRKQSALRRLMGISRGLTQDRFDEESQNQVKEKLVTKMGSEVQRIRLTPAYLNYANQIAGLDLNTVAILNTGITEERQAYTIEAVSSDIDRHFQQAGRLLGNGLHMDYWRNQGDREADEVKIEVAVLTQVPGAMAEIESYAEQEFDQIYERHKRDIAGLKEQRRKHYEKLRLATATPRDIAWRLPESIDFRRTANAPQVHRHLYVEEDGKFRIELGTWEKEVLEEELADPTVIAWLRNTDRKPWSLEIPYEEGGTIRPMFPDMIIIRQHANHFLFDILEPHDASRSDNVAKAIGLAKFAEKHWHRFDRIQLIRKKRAPDGRDRYFRLDVGKESVRRKVLSLISNAQLDQVFEEEAKLR
jgi:type III restriction enzyme